MYKIIFILLIACSQLVAQDINTSTLHQVYVINYIKNKNLKDKIQEYYNSFHQKFVDIKITYREFEDESFYNDFRSKGVIFLSDFMIKNNQKVILIFYQKKENKKITIISQKVKINVTRNISLSSTKLPEQILYDKIISKSLQMLGELLVLHPYKRML